MQENISNNGNSKSAKPKQGRQKKTVKKPKKITDSYLHNSGLYYLQRFASSSGNFRKVMRRKIAKSCQAHPEQDKEQCHDMLEKLIERFIELGLLDDELYAKSAVTTMRRSGKSERQIMGRLTAKNMYADDIKRALENYSEESYTQDDELTAATIFARKKRLGKYDNTGSKDLKKQLAAFARAGFSYDIATKVLNTPLEDNDCI